MVGCNFTGLSSVLSVFLFKDQGWRSSCSRGKKQKLKARGWGCWGEGVKGHLKRLLACDICHTHILLPKAGHMAKAMVIAWGSVFSLPRRHWKIKWEGALIYYPNSQVTTMAIPFSFQVNSLGLSSAKWNWRGRFLGVLREGDVYMV